MSTHTHTRSPLRNTPRWKLTNHNRACMLVLLAVLAMLLPHRAWADFDKCTAKSMYYDFTPTAITYSGTRDGLTAGTALTPGWQYSTTVADFFYNSPGGNCNFTTVTGAILGDAEAAIGVTHNDGTDTYQVFKTNVPGVGYIVAVNPWNMGWKGINSTNYQAISPFYPEGKQSLNLGIRMRFVVYSQLKTGFYTLKGQLIYSINAVEGPVPFPGIAQHRQAYSMLRMQPTSLTITARGCAIVGNQTNLAVSLPNVSLKNFTGVGATPGGSSPNFNFDLDCEPELKVHAVMSDASDAANRSDHLTLASGSTATGVGVQIFKNGEATPLAFGPDSAQPSTQNQWYIGETPAGSGGMFFNSFKAGYVQTAPIVEAGTVKAIATITFSYQ